MNRMLAAAGIQAPSRAADIPRMNAVRHPDSRRLRMGGLLRVGTAPGLRGLAGAALLTLSATALAESRITALGPSSDDGRAVGASARLRIEVHVVRVLSLQAARNPVTSGPSGGAATSAWSNGGTLMLGCAGAAACVSRAAGSHGVSVFQAPSMGMTIAQP